jgi:alcohol dehydrogenase
MLDGIYRNPTTIIFGKESERQVGAEVSKQADKVLLVFGSQNIKQFGLYDLITESLNNSKVRFIELSGVQANPTADLVYEGINFCRRENISFILAVGGASVIDTAKAIAIGVPFQGDFFEFFEKKKAPKKTINVGVVLTISGAGSESSDGAVITKNGNKYSCGSPIMYPTFAILNPEITFTVPKFLTSCGVVDAISHVLERYFSNTSYVDTSNHICEGLIKTLMKYGKLVLKKPHNFDIRAEIMWASKLAHDNTAGFGRKQDWATHTIAHEIAARYNQPHGAILAVLFPAWMSHVNKQNSKVFLRFSSNIFDININSMSDSVAIKSGIDAYKLFLKEMGMPTSLRMLGITTPSEFISIAEHCSRTTESGTIGNLTRLTQDDIVQILFGCSK